MNIMNFMKFYETNIVAKYRLLFKYLLNIASYNNPFPVSKISKKQYVGVNAELTKTHSFRLFFSRFYPLSYKIISDIV